MALVHQRYQVQYAEAIRTQIAAQASDDYLQEHDEQHEAISAIAEALDNYQGKHGENPHAYRC